MDGLYRRPAVKRRLVEIAEQTVGLGVDLGVDGRDAEIVTVSYDWAGAIEGDSAIYFGEIDGESTTESVGTNPLTDDTFTVGFRITVWGFETAELADEAAMRVLNGFAVPLRSLQRLIGDAAPDTEMPPDGPRSPFDSTCTVGTYDGPFHNFPQSDGDDYSAAINGFVRCVSNVK